MFRFRLQPALNYRKQIEEQVMSEFADMKSRLEREKETLRSLKRRKADLISRLKKMGENKFRAADASIYFSYVDYIKCEERCQEEVICKGGEKLEEKRKELVDASKKRRILEIIKEKKLEEYMLSVSSREQKEMDEAGIVRFVMK